MEIPSAMNSGFQGLQSAGTAAEQAAENIVTDSMRLNESQQSLNNNETNSEVISKQELPDLNQNIVNLKVAEFQAKSSTEVIRSADDSLGTLLDVTA